MFSLVSNDWFSKNSLLFIRKLKLKNYSKQWQNSPMVQQANSTWQPWVQIPLVFVLWESLEYNNFLGNVMQTLAIRPNFWLLFLAKNLSICKWRIFLGWIKPKAHIKSWTKGGVGVWHILLEIDPIEILKQGKI